MILSDNFLAFHAVLHPGLHRRLYNTHCECSCSAMAMLEANLWNVDSLSSANFFCSIIGQVSEPIAVASEGQSRQRRQSSRFNLRKRKAKILPHSPYVLFLMARGEKYKGKVLPVERFLRKVGISLGASTTLLL